MLRIIISTLEVAGIIFERLEQFINIFMKAGDESALLFVGAQGWSALRFFPLRFFFPFDSL